jgi:putative two-component system response regulator
MAVADVYDALRSKRTYKDAFPHDKSRQILLDGSGTQFDPAAIRAFAAVDGQFERVGSGTH